jgi:serine/threonine protein kinase
MKLDSLGPFEQRYDLRKQLWLDGPHGGWLALDRILGREVVVNLPYRPDDDQRFLQMAQIRARLRHAHLVPLYDLGETKDGKPFFTEPYLKATDIRRMRLDGDDKADDVTLPRLVSYLLDVCKAVAFVHANGFLHLDLHPGNVLVVQESQEVFVVCGHPSLPPVHVDRVGVGAWPKGILWGVPGYMAPEQVDPERLGAADVLTDVYGLGGILFEILYDYPPNGRQATSPIEILTALAKRKGSPERGTFGRRAARCRDLARKLEPVCLRALEYARTARPVSAPAFMREVEQCGWGWAS